MSKPNNEKTESINYAPIYYTINATNNPYLVAMVMDKCVETAEEYPGIIQYVTINSGNPPQPPICPPGQNCNG